MLQCAAILNPMFLCFCYVQDNGGPAFREGSLVEVSRSAESFGQSWNPATILKVIGSTNFLVQYRHVGDDGELVTEIVDTEYIRPARSIIRMDSKYRFSPSSHVEVFHEGSWWPGIILETSSGVFGKMYVVKLKSYTTGMDNVDGVDKLTVENTKLRPQFEWDGRKWMRCMTKKKDTKAKVHILWLFLKKKRYFCCVFYFDDDGMLKVLAFMCIV